MTTIRNSTLAVIASALTLGQGAMPVRAAGPELVRVAPLRGVSFDIGSKHALSYFQSEKGVCRITLMVADIDADEVAPHAGARFTVSAEAGRSVRLDTGEGKSLEFACDAKAAAMSIRPVDQLAWSAAR